jgi:hypothetical protein
MVNGSKHYHLLTLMSRLSGGRNRPFFSAQVVMDSMAPSFSVGSVRVYASVVLVLLCPSQQPMGSACYPGICVMTPKFKV